MKTISKILSKHSTVTEASQLMDLTTMAWIENLHAKDISSATSLTDKMINSNRDAATVIFGLLFEFKYGIGPKIREFDKNSILTKGILDWSLIEKGRDFFYQKKAPFYLEGVKKNDNTLLNKNPMAMQKNGGDNEIYDASFTPVELANAGLDLIRQYIGGFYMEIYPNKQGKEMEFVLYNDVNLKSLVLHYLQINEMTGKEVFPEKYPRINGQVTPLGEVKQIFKWKENIDTKQFNRYLK
jgi:hypothetical protein